MNDEEKSKYLTDKIIDCMNKENCTLDVSLVAIGNVLGSILIMLKKQDFDSTIFLDKIYNGIKEHL